MESIHSMSIPFFESALFFRFSRSTWRMFMNMPKPIMEIAIDNSRSIWFAIVVTPSLVSSFWYDVMILVGVGINSLSSNYLFL